MIYESNLTAMLSPVRDDILVVNESNRVNPVGVIYFSQFDMTEFWKSERQK